MKDKVFLRAFEPDDYMTTLRRRKNPELWKGLHRPYFFVSSFTKGI